MARNEPEKREAKINSNKAMMDRRLNTPTSLTFRWHSLSLAAIAIGIFIILHAILYVAMEAGGLPRYLGIFSCVRIPNDYNPDVIRRIYYVDGKVIGTLFIPGLFFLLIGCAMQLYRTIKLKKTVNLGDKNEREY